MLITNPLTPGITAAKAIKFFLYTVIVLVLQAHFVQRLPYEALRVDLLLPVMFAIAVECSPLTSVFWAGILGFMADNFSGEFWGMHVGSFILTVCLVNMASERFDWRNPAYQMGLVGLSALVQSMALGLFLSFTTVDMAVTTSFWISLCLRALLSATIAPFLIYPILNPRLSV
jgi:rod shape-determining protein MreD